MNPTTTNPNKTGYYITTAIDYPNANPHMGHAYEKIISDVLARWNKVLGKDTFFMTGLDEHGQKLQARAEEKGMSPKAFVDEKAIVFRQLCELLNLDLQYFIRTSDSDHEKRAADVFNKVYEKGDIYKGKYRGFYCVACETFLTKSQLKDGEICPECKRDVKIVEEEAYFFKMSHYQDRLLTHFREHPDFIRPKSRYNETMYRIEHEELKDLCVSRSTFDWGITLPNDPKHVIYVWFDALLNYITGIGYPDSENYQKFWPADVHVIGKDILWFHTVIWPTILMAIDVPLPKCVYVHGFINDANGEKMSKSKGNVIDPVELIDSYGVDALRYYLLRTVPSGEDGSFSRNDLIDYYNGELANDLGNLVMRVTKLIAKSEQGNTIKSDERIEPTGLKSIRESEPEIVDAMETCHYNKALELIWQNVRKINAYLNENEPWKKAENEKRHILYTAISAVHYVALMLHPFIPDSIEKVLDQIGPSKNPALMDFVFHYEYAVNPGDAIFPKIEKEEPVETNQKQHEGETRMEQNDTTQEQLPLDIRIGTIENVEDHPKADKLYVMTVSFGDEKRQIIAGLKPYFERDALLGRVTSFVYNLEPAKLRGMESQGMILIAEDENDENHLGFVEVQPEDNTDTTSFIGKQVKVDGETEVNRPESISFKEFTSSTVVVEDGVLLSDGKELILDGATLRVPDMKKAHLS
jgi:methionyl-tRNA synthetase